MDQIAQCDKGEKPSLLYAHVTLLLLLIAVVTVFAAASQLARIFTL